MDSFATEPSQADDDQHMADPGRGQLNLEGAAEVVNRAKVLSKKNMKMLRKRPGAPKYVRHFVKLIGELAEEHDGSAGFGPVEVKIWGVLLKCDEKGKKHLKDEEKIRRSKETERKKKEKRRARKKSKKARKSKTKKSSKSGKWSDSSSDSSSTSDSSSRSSSDDSSDTDSSSSGDRKDKRSSGAERRSRPSQFEFHYINSKNTSGCGMASGRTVLDHRVRNAGTVGRGTGRSKPRSSAADDMQARGGGGVRSEMWRRRDCEMALKNSWLRKENHSGRHMHQFSGGDWSQAPDWGMWQRCGSSSGTRASMGGYPRGRPWRGDCWRLQGMGTSKGRSKRSYLE